MGSMPGQGTKIPHACAVKKIFLIEKWNSYTNLRGKLSYMFNMGKNYPPEIVFTVSWFRKKNQTIVENLENLWLCWTSNFKRHISIKYSFNYI